MYLKIPKSNSLVLSWYIYFPTLFFSISLFYSLQPKIYYDIFVIFVALYSISAIIANKKIINFHLVSLLSIFLLYLLFTWLFKEINVFNVSAWENSRYLLTFIREIKPIVYLFSAIIFISAFRPPDLIVYVWGGAILSVLILLDFFWNLFIFNEIRRPYIIDESNYDNFLILISLIALFLLRCKKFYYFYVLFGIATLVSQSKTGILTYFILSSVFFIWDKKDYKYILFFIGFIIILSPIVIIIMQYRLQISDDLLQLDRFRMISVFLEYIRNAEIYSVIFGQVPGAPITDYDLRLDWFIKNQTEVLGATGVHPFNLHGFHARFISSWGVISYIIFLIMILQLTKNTPSLKYLLLFVFLQGVSLGIIYLSAVSFIFLIFLCSIHVHYNFKSSWQPHI